MAGPPYSQKGTQVMVKQLEPRPAVAGTPSTNGNGKKERKVIKGVELSFRMMDSRRPESRISHYPPEVSAEDRKPVYPGSAFVPVPGVRYKVDLWSNRSGTVWAADFDLRTLRERAREAAKNETDQMTGDVKVSLHIPEMRPGLVECQLADCPTRDTPKGPRRSYRPTGHYIVVPENLDWPERLRKDERILLHPTRGAFFIYGGVKGQTVGTAILVPTKAEDLLPYYHIDFDSGQVAWEPEILSPWQVLGIHWAMTEKEIMDMHAAKLRAMRRRFQIDTLDMCEEYSADQVEALRNALTVNSSSLEKAEKRAIQHCRTLAVIERHSKEAAARRLKKQEAARKEAATKKVESAVEQPAKVTKTTKKRSDPPTSLKQEELQELQAFTLEWSEILQMAGLDEDRAGVCALEAKGNPSSLDGERGIGVLCAAGFTPDEATECWPVIQAVIATSAITKAWNELVLCAKVGGEINGLVNELAGVFQTSASAAADYEDQQLLETFEQCRRTLEINDPDLSKRLLKAFRKKYKRTVSDEETKPKGRRKTKK